MSTDVAVTGAIGEGGGDAEATVAITGEVEGDDAVAGAVAVAEVDELIEDEEEPKKPRVRADFEEDDDYEEDMLLEETNEVHPQNVVPVLAGLSKQAIVPPLDWHIFTMLAPWREFHDIFFSVKKYDSLLPIDESERLIVTGGSGIGGDSEGATGEASEEMAVGGDGEIGTGTGAAAGEVEEYMGEDAFTKKENYHEFCLDFWFDLVCFFCISWLFFLFKALFTWSTSMPTL